MIQQTLYSFGAVSSAYYPGPLSFEELKSEIDAGRPIIAGYRGSFGGHVVVINGYDAAGIISINDPNYGRIQVPYGQVFSYGGGLTWAETIYAIH